MKFQKKKKIMIGTDIHFLAKELFDEGHAFSNMNECGDGKQIQQGEVLLDLFLAEGKKQKADAILLTGDLTLNGEVISHERFKEKLDRCQGEGIPVYVLPGNHDIGHRKAAKYQGDQMMPVESMTEEGFVSLYQSYGYKDALSKDGHSLSYVTRVSEEIWLFCLDNCAREKGHPLKFGMLGKETLEWLEVWLQRAKEEKVMPIIAGHYNLALHNQMFRHGFSMRNREQVLDLLERYDARLFLSGHMHMQHIEAAGRVTDIATSSLVTYPHQYGMLTLEGEKISYTTKQLELSKEVMELCRRFYISHAMKQAMMEAQKNTKLSESEKVEMAICATEMNHAYFAGTFYQLQEDIIKTTGWNLWENYGRESFFYKYLKSMFLDSMTDHNQFEIEYQ